MALLSGSGGGGNVLYLSVPVRPRLGHEHAPVCTLRCLSDVAQQAVWDLLVTDIEFSAPWLWRVNLNVINKSSIRRATNCLQTALDHGELTVYLGII